MEEPSSSETSGRTRSTRSNILEDAIPHSHRREYLKSYIVESDSLEETGSQAIEQVFLRIGLCIVVASGIPA
jgi:hypothetical protein